VVYKLPESLAIVFYRVTDFKLVLFFFVLFHTIILFIYLFIIYLYLIYFQIISRTHGLVFFRKIRCFTLPTHYTCVGSSFFFGIRNDSR